MTPITGLANQIILHHLQRSNEDWHECTVEKLAGRRKRRYGRGKPMIEYLVRWKGWGPEWEIGYRDQRPYKWYLSGTPIDTSPADFAGSISTMEKTSWSEPESPFHFCRVSVQQRWGKLFTNYLNAKERSSRSINEWKEHLAEAEAEFPLTLTRFLIIRTDNSQL